MEDAVERKNAEARLEKMAGYGAATTCRRRLLLEYFGEDWQQDNCGGCDVCLSEGPAGARNGHSTEEKETAPFDGTEIAQKVLSAVVRTGGRFGAAHVVNVLRGSRSRRVLELGHDKLTVYGIARGMARDELRDVIEQLTGKGLLAVATGDYPTLGVTEAGKEFLKNRESVELVRRSNGLSAPSAPKSPTDSDLYETLRALRRKLADERGIPTYVVFTNATLRALADQMPRTGEAMRHIKGVGSKRFEQFGEHFLSAIAASVGENAHSSNGLSASPGRGTTQAAGRSDGEVTADDARAALAAYESALDAKDVAEQARREALSKLKAWLSKQGVEETTLPGRNGERSVVLVRRKRRSVDFDKLESLVDAETRAEIVTERDWEFVRVV